MPAEGIKPIEWHEICAVVLELWPEGGEDLSLLEAKLREIDIDLRCLSHHLSENIRSEGRDHLLQLLSVTGPLVREVGQTLAITFKERSLNANPAMP